MLTIRLLESCQTIRRPGSGILYLSPERATRAATESNAMNIAKIVCRNIVCFGGFANLQAPNPIAEPHRLSRQPIQI